MDLPNYNFRRDKSPPAEDPVDGELSADEIDDNWDQTQTALEQVDAEFVKKADAVPVGPPPEEFELAGTDTVVVMRAGAPYEISLSALQAFMGVEPSLTAPGAFALDDFDVTPIAGGFALDFIALPPNGGSPITELQYQIDGGSWVPVSGTGTGSRNVTGLPEVEVSVSVRAVNAIDPGEPSEPKLVTPAATGGGTPGELVAGLNTGDGAGMTWGWFSRHGAFFAEGDYLATYYDAAPIDLARSVLGSDLAGLPEGATITSVQLELFVSYRSGAATYQVAQCLRAIGVTPSTPGATNYATGSAWAGTSGTGVGDTTPVLTAVTAPASGAMTLLSSPEIVAALQSWADGGRAQPFWLLSSLDAAPATEVRIRSGDATVTDGERPRIRVGYTT